MDLAIVAELVTNSSFTQIQETARSKYNLTPCQYFAFEQLWQMCRLRSSDFEAEGQETDFFQLHRLGLAHHPVQTPAQRVPKCMRLHNLELV